MRFGDCACAETSFEYERQVQPRPKLRRWAVELDGLLAANAAKSARAQLTLIRIFEELRGRGYRPVQRTLSGRASSRSGRDRRRLASGGEEGIEPTIGVRLGGAL